MNFTIMVPQVVEIPDKELAKVTRRVIRQFSLPKGSPINTEDLLRSAQFLGIIELPEEWSIDNSEEIEQSELFELAKATK